MAAVERQMTSVRELGIDVDALAIEGTRGVKYLQRLPDLLRRARNADVVHAHYGYCGWLGRAAWPKPLVISFMGSDLLGKPNGRGGVTWPSRFAAALNRRLPALAEAVIVKSREMADLLREDVHVVPNGVDLEQFQPRSREGARRELNWDPDAQYVLFPGCPDERRKGYDLALASVEEASQLLQRRIELVSLCRVDRALVPKYMNACNVLLMTSMWEGSPNAIKEALASELPVVSVPVGDVEQLLAGARGCAIEERDPRRLGQAVASLINGDRTNGRELLRRHRLDLESVARQVVSVYEQAVRARAGERAVPSLSRAR
jgi:glycosyltransferase involved in cell wall biosynthesis